MKRVMSVMILAGLAAPALAHEGDVGLKIVNGQIVTGKVENDVVIPGERAFAAEFGTLAPGYADDPGLFAEVGAFEAGSGLGFNILKAVRSWTGSDFSTLSSSAIRIEYGPNSVTTPGSDVTVAGFAFPVPGSGGFDEHWDFYIDPNTQGIYLLEVELWSTSAGVGKSDPLWFVFNNGEDELLHDEAVEWVEENLVPAPGAMALMGAAGVFASRRRRVK